MKTRRDALKIAAAIAAAPALHAQHEHGGTVQIANAPKKIYLLKPDEMKLAERLADLIIPRSDTPGAVDAGVTHFMDWTASKDTSIAKRLRAGLAQLKAKKFLELKPEAQVAMLQDMETKNDPFFKLIKDLTVDGFYSSKEGLMQDLGWNANTYVREFKGCTHPEHQG
jgi:hypothetical protein